MGEQSADEVERANDDAPWWDWLIPVYFVLGVIGGTIIMSFSLPSGPQEMWVLGGICGGFVGASVLVFIMGGEIDE